MFRFLLKKANIEFNRPRKIYNKDVLIKIDNKWISGKANDFYWNGKIKNWAYRIDTKDKSYSLTEDLIKLDTKKNRESLLK